jgi:hypothetical protein
MTAKKLAVTLALSSVAQSVDLRAVMRAVKKAFLLVDWLVVLSVDG